MLKKIITAMICVSTLFCVSCATENSSTQENKQDEFVSEVLLNSFENYQECYDFYYSGNFVVEFDDTNNVTDGSYSMKLSSDNVNAGKTS
ncbi:MAG: hypothetical protein IIX01_01105, partial [Clostridia bacterium]|nr:hypothetical protein [Clostridia bacterium]